MRIDVDGAGFLTAERALATGNRRCAEHLDDLTDALAGLGGMAGDDATSADFAAAYDTAAAEVVAGLGDCVTALACLGRLTATSRAEHERAEAGAVLRGVVVPGSVVAPDGEVSPAGGPGDLGWVGAMPSPPPTALGGDWSAVPTGLGWVIDLIQGFAWPSADVGELRAAGATWVDCARAVADLTADCDAAVRGLGGELSPEIPLAVDACQEVSDQLAAIAEEAYGLGRACEQYADQVESHRAEVVALVVQLLAETVVIQGAGMLLNSVTGGGGTVGATALTGTRVAAITPDVLAVAARLRAANEVLAASVRNAAVRVTIARGRLEKFRYARSVGSPTRRGRSGSSPQALGPRPRVAAHARGARVAHDRAARGQDDRGPGQATPRRSGPQVSKLLPRPRHRRARTGALAPTGVRRHHRLAGETSQDVILHTSLDEVVGSTVTRAATTSPPTFAWCSSETRAWSTDTAS